MNPKDGIRHCKPASQGNAVLIVREGAEDGQDQVKHWAGQGYDKILCVRAAAWVEAQERHTGAPNSRDTGHSEMAYLVE